MTTATIHDTNRRINIPTPNGMRISIANRDVGLQNELNEMVMEGLRSFKENDYIPMSRMKGRITHEYVPGPMRDKSVFMYDVFRDDGILLARGVVEGEIIRSREDELVAVRY